MKAPLWQAVWGSACGPVLHLAPHTRLIGGFLVFVTCMAAPTNSPTGLSLLGTTLALWLFACRPPRNMFLLLVFFGLVMHLPVFLLAPLIDKGGAFSTTWNSFIRGIAGLFATVATGTTLRREEVPSALARLPLPALAATILLQILHQTETLLGETRAIASAMAVRGATSGAGTARQVIAALPEVWLPRVLKRSDRVAAAMTIRGYSTTSFRLYKSSSMGMVDRLVLSGLLASLLLAFALRWWPMP